MISSVTSDISNICINYVTHSKHVLVLKSQCKHSSAALTFYWSKFILDCITTYLLWYAINNAIISAIHLPIKTNILLLMPCPFTGPKIFCARPKIYLHIVAVTNILCQTKIWFAFSKIGFCAGTKVFEEALNAVKFFEPAQKIWIGTKHFGTCKRTRHKS